MMIPRRLDLLRQIFPSLATYLYVSELVRALEGCSSILDVGCGALSPIRYLGGMKVGMDAYVPALEGARMHGTHHFYLLGEAQMVDRLFYAQWVSSPEQPGSGSPRTSIWLDPPSLSE